jgi:hypothetical protein
MFYSYFQISLNGYMKRFSLLPTDCDYYTFLGFYSCLSLCAPPGFPHVNEEDEVVRGYFIPKGTMIHQNFQYVLRLQ